VKNPTTFLRNQFLPCQNLAQSKNAHFCPFVVFVGIITLRKQQVILDCDVADLYGVETKEINQAVRNNPEKFPEGYIWAIDDQEKNELVKNFDRFEKQKHSSVLPRAFTEKGLYMLATILKSPRAVQTTIENRRSYNPFSPFFASCPQAASMSCPRL
jgi:hypothetical protein